MGSHGNTQASPPPPMLTHICQQRQPGHPLHGENQERDHGQAPTRRLFLDLPQNFPEGCIAVPATGALSHSDFGKRSGGQVGPVWGGLGMQRPHSRQLLQGALLIDLVGAVGNVRVEMMLGMVLQNVADVLHAHLSFVPLLQGFKEPAASK